jgi:LmbE family N-acetylglucosaminyl deacetylase
MRVLVIVAHPDDEVLGCGATLCRHNKHDDQLFSISLCNGVGARGDDSQAASLRAKAAGRLLSALLRFLGPNGWLTAISQTMLLIPSRFWIS